MPTALITGANSGIGHALASLLISESWIVHAADIQTTGPIADLSAKSVIQLDQSDPKSIAALKEKLAGETLDVLLNVAGVIAPAAKDKFETVDLQTLERTFKVNTFGPLLLSQALLPNLLTSSAPKILNISSRVGSIGDNSTGKSYSYRASKAALNSVSKSMAVDLKERGVAVILLHPGITRTNLVLEDHDNPRAVDAGVAARDLWDVAKSKGLNDSGKFFHREGWEIAW